MILVDSNIWIYYLDTRLPESGPVGRALPDLLLSDETLLPALVQLEVVHYIARRMADRVDEAVQLFFAQPGEEEPLRTDTVTEACRVLLANADAGIGGRDAALLVIARRRGARIATADKPLAKVARKMGIAVTDPTAGRRRR